MLYMGPLLTILPAWALGIRTYRKADDTYAVAALIEILILYLFGMANHIILGIYFVLGLTLLCAVYIIYSLLRKKKVFSALKSRGMLVFLAVIVFFAWFSVGRDLNDPDSIYCWGLAVKNDLFYQSILDVRSTALNPHPPAAILWNLYAVGTWIGYADGICLFAQNVLTYSFMIPLIHKVRGNHRSFKSVLLGITLLLVPFVALVSYEPYTSLMVDALLGTMCYYAIFKGKEAIERRSLFDTTAALLAFMVLPIVKRSGILFTAIGLCLVFGLYFYVSKPLKLTAQKVLLVIALLLLVSLPALSWNLYNALLDPDASFTFTAGSLLLPFLSVAFAFIGYRILHRISNLPRKSVAYAFLAASIIILYFVLLYRFILNSDFGKDCLAQLFRTILVPLDINGIPLISQNTLFLLGILVWIILQNVGAKIGISSRVASYGIAVFYGFIFLWFCYLNVMLYLQVTVVGPANYNSTNINIRYMSPFTVLFILGCIDFILEYTTLLAQLRGAYIGLLILVIFLTRPSDYLPDMLEKHEAQQYYGFSDAGITLSSGDRVFFIDEVDDYLLRDREFYSYVMPATTNFTDFVIANGSIGKLTKTKTEFEEQLIEGSYNYIYLQSIDKDFKRVYGSLFEDPDQIKTGTVYLIHVNDNHVQLVSAAQ